MELSAETLEGWLDAPGSDGHRERLEHAQSKLDDPEWRVRRRVHVVGGEVRTRALLFDTGPGELGLALRPRGDTVEVEDCPMVEEAVGVAWSIGAERLGLRIPSDRVSDALLAAVATTAGTEIGERVEFKAELAELPPDGPSRLVWRPAQISEAAGLIERCAVDAMDGLEPGEEAEAIVQGWMSSADLTTDPAGCLHIGAVDHQDVAIVCAQVEEKRGWATLTFMGLVPELRGRGLGHDVQRHGISMLRAQGGSHYHGGTSLENAAMRACFARQGIAEWKRFRQFRWTRP